MVNGQVGGGTTPEDPEEIVDITTVTEIVQKEEGEKAKNSNYANKTGGNGTLKNTGETVYQLSASSGLDRTSLQRMITGKRLPGMDFVRQFCDSIRINPSQRQELIELYKIEKIGKEIYYNRKYIQELLRVISTQQMLFSSGFHSLTSLPFYSGDFSLDVEKKF